MNSLKELNRVNGAGKICVDLTTARGKKIDRLFRYLRETDDPDDDEAAKLLYGKTKTKGYGPYKKVKHYLKYELINAATAINEGEKVSKDDRIGTALYCNRLVSMGSILMYKGAYKVAVEFLEQAFKIADDFNLVVQASESSSELMRLYAQNLHDKKKLAYYTEKASHYQSLRHDIFLIEKELTIVRNMIQENQVSEEVAAYAARQSERYRYLIEQHEDVRIYAAYYYMKISGLFAAFDFKGGAAASKEALAFFNRRGLADSRQAQVFNSTLITACVQLGEYEEGAALLEKTMKMVEKNGMNYFKMIEHGILLSLRSGRYQEAYEWYSKVDQKVMHETLNSGYAEYFPLYRGYLSFLVGIGKVNVKKGDKEFSSLRLGRILNETVGFSRDKRTMNVHLLIVQMLYFTILEQYNSALDRIDSIKKYCGRHLRRDENYRSRCFLHMLLELPINGFHRVAVERNAKKWQDKLAEMPFDIVSQSHEVEIIPFETLWELVVESLKNKRINHERIRALNR